jgi:hypothetical protein
MKPDAPKLRENRSGMVFSGSGKLPVEVLLLLKGWQFLLLALTGACIYSGALNHAVQFDRIQQTVENPHIRELKPYWQYTYEEDFLYPAKEVWEESLFDLDASLIPDQLEVGPCRGMAMKEMLNPDNSVWYFLHLLRGITTQALYS